MTSCRFASERPEVATGADPARIAAQTHGTPDTLQGRIAAQRTGGPDRIDVVGRDSGGTVGNGNAARFAGGVVDGDGLAGRALPAAVGHAIPAGARGTIRVVAVVTEAAAARALPRHGVLVAVTDVAVRLA